MQRDPAAVFLDHVLRIEHGAGRRTAELAGVNSGLLTRWKKGEAQVNPTLETLKGMAEALEIPLWRLLYDEAPTERGRGEPLPSEWESCRWLPVIAEVGAGPGRDWREYADDRERWPFHKNQLDPWGGADRVALVKVSDDPRYGSSMAPRIHPGDRLLVQLGPFASDEVANADVYVVHVRDEGSVAKRLFVGEDSLTLFSDNPLYQPAARTFTGDDSIEAGVVVQGRVVKVLGAAAR